jgi:deoxyhypusine synthase
MVDAIVSTGAIIVDQDFFEALGFNHYCGTPSVDDRALQRLNIDRIYDTYIDENQLRVCDMTIAEIAGNLKPRPYSSREFIHEMGCYLEAEGTNGKTSVVHVAYKQGLPIFVPAFSDCSAGFGLLYHQYQNKTEHVTIDSVKDFRELTEIKLACKDTGIVMVGGGVPKNFTQDVVVATDILGQAKPLHKYAIQITVADERDGALSGSTLKEACSWGKVDLNYEQMVFCEATIALPLLASDAYHRGEWKKRPLQTLTAIF